MASPGELGGCCRDRTCVGDAAWLAMPAPRKNQAHCRSLSTRSKRERTSLLPEPRSAGAQNLNGHQGAAQSACARQPSDQRQLALCVMVKVTGTVATCCSTPRKAWTLRCTVRAARLARRRVPAAAAEAQGPLHGRRRRGGAIGTATEAPLIATACIGLGSAVLLASFRTAVSSQYEGPLGAPRQIGGGSKGQNWMPTGAPRIQKCQIAGWRARCAPAWRSP